MKKEILKLIFKILKKICIHWHDWKEHFEEDLDELEKIIDDLPF